MAEHTTQLCPSVQIKTLLHYDHWVYKYEKILKPHNPMYTCDHIRFDQTAEKVFTTN